jgi:uncharacterized protein YpiB (UPF0302 family)
MSNENQNDMESIDKKIRQSAVDNLKSLEKSLNNLNEDELLTEINEMLVACDKEELKKILQLLIDMDYSSWEEH